MPLTDVQIRSLPTSERHPKLWDGNGLYLLVSRSGAKGWRFKYRFGGKENLLSFGVYPIVSLKEARKRRDEARRLLAEGLDPAHERKLRRSAKTNDQSNTFETVAREWLEAQSPRWVSTHQSRIELRLRNDVLPYLGERPIAEISAGEVLTCLRRVQLRGSVETAHRILQNISQIFRFGISTQRAISDPTRDLRGALRVSVTKHRASITEPLQIGGLLRAIAGYHGSFVTRCALRLAPLVFVRPGELRQAEWAEFDLDDASWNIRKERMKLREPLLVPLSTQALEVLVEIKQLTGKGRYVFPSARSRDRPMSNNAVLAALRRMGYDKAEMSGHGFRAMARTVLDEVLHFRPDLIEQQLAHAVRDPNGRAYNRTKHLPERRVMMQRWADFLDQLREDDGAKDGSSLSPAASDEQ